MPCEQTKPWFPETVPDYDQVLFGRYLEAIREGVLYGQESNASIYRLLWLRLRDRSGFSPAICIRIEHTPESGSARVMVKETKESKDRKPGVLIQNEEKSLTLEQFYTLQTMLDRTDFWHIPTTEKGPIGGELWLIEGLHQGHYHAVVRCCLEVAVGAIIDESVMLKLPAAAIPAIESFRPLSEIGVFMLQAGKIVIPERP